MGCKVKLVLKITAGIILAWVIILVTGFVLAMGTAKAVSEALIQPSAEQMNSSIQQNPLETVTDTLNGFAEPFEQMATQATPTEDTYWLDVDMATCNEEGGTMGYRWDKGIMSCKVAK